MKKYISAIAAGLLLLGASSCSKDTEGLTGITYYAVIELDGPVYDIADSGVPYTAPAIQPQWRGRT